MTLARITNYVDGNVLTGAQLNNEFDNILNNGPSLVSASVPTVSVVQGLEGSMRLAIGSFAANGYQLRSSSGLCSLTATSSFSVNTQTPGPVANGRDQAAAFASTDVHFYAITTGGTSTAAAGIVSTRPPSLGPTLPAGYSAWGYLASVKYQVVTSVTAFNSVVSGNTVLAQAPGHVLASGADISGTDVLVDLQPYIPQIAPTYMLGVFGVGGMSAAAGGVLEVNHSVLATTGGNAIINMKTYVGSATNTSANQSIRLGGGIYILANLNTPPKCYYNQSVITGTSGVMSLDILGYTVPNGGG